MLQIRAGGVPVNLRATRNRPRRSAFTRTRPIVRPEPVPSTSQAPEIPPTPETSHRPALRSNIAAPVPGTSRDAMPGPSHQSGNVPATDRTSSVTPQPNSHMATRASARFRPYQRPERRIVSPPHWRPDLVHESSSDDEDAINRQLEEERRLSTYLAMRRVPLPVSIVRPHRATDPTRGDNGRILHMQGANMERNSSRNESQLPAWMRPRRNGSLRVEHEEDFVPAGYFPNLSREGTSRHHQGQGNVHPAGTNTMPTNIPTDDVSGGSRVLPLPQSSNDQHVRSNSMPSAMTAEASTSTGRKFSRKNPSVGKSPRNLLKARDIPKELRENLRALAYNRRKSARLRGRRISNDDSDEGNLTSGSSAESSDERHTTSSESLQSSYSISSEASQKSVGSTSNESVQSIRQKNAQTTGSKSVHSASKENVQSASRENAESTSRESVN
ncbi:hypothetical protein ACF0H5_010952 [Mactra antiquata]